MTEKASQIISELREKVGKLPPEANWFGNVDSIKQLINNLEKEMNDEKY